MHYKFIHKDLGILKNSMAGNTNRDIFVRNLLEESIKLPAHKMNKAYKETILEELKNKVEGKCTKHGFIGKDTVEIAQIDAGMVEMASLNGNMLFKVKFYGDICNPAPGCIIKCKITNINKFGVLAEVKPVLEIIIAKNSVNIKSDIDLETVNIGDEVLVEVVGKKYEIGDTRISIIGRIVTSSTSTKSKKTLRGVTANVDEDQEEGIDDVENVSDESDVESDNVEVEDDEEEDDDEEHQDDEDDEEEEFEGGDAEKAKTKNISGGFFDSDVEEDNQFNMFDEVSEEENDSDGYEQIDD